MEASITANFLFVFRNNNNWSGLFFAGLKAAENAVIVAALMDKSEYISNKIFF
jgi:hypothetical protein